MPPSNVPLDPSSLIDISHESLIRNWERLRQWVDEEVESVETYRRLAETAALHARGTAGLWQDPDLSHALLWREREQPGAAWAERYHRGFAAAIAFLDDSRRARDAERRRRAFARRRVQIVSLAIAAVLGIFAVTAGLQWRSARQALAVAAQERDRARAGLDTATNVARRLMSDVWEGARIAGLPAKTLDELTHHAIAGYDQVIRMDPTNAIAYNARAVAYFRLLDFDHAFADIGRAIALNPSSSRAYNNRCFFAAMADRQLEQAVADCDQALRLSRNEASARDGTSYGNLQVATLDSRGYANLRLGRLDAAIADFNAVLVIDPKFASSLYGRGLAKMQKGDKTGGEADVAAAKALSSDTVEDLARYGIK
jgi:tetratricopeptide (TPR) repeat protein